MILVDYRCDGCDGVSEHFVRTPAPATVNCPACRTPARRRFAPVGLSGRAAPPAEHSYAPPGPALCRTNPDVPGLCHMTPEAGRAWIARARRDNRRLERELERQERSLQESDGKPADPVTHDHGSSHGHGHGETAGEGHRQPAT